SGGPQILTFGETFTSLRTLLTPFATTYTKVFFSSGGVVSWNLPAVSLVAVAAGVDDGAEPATRSNRLTVWLAATLPGTQLIWPKTSAVSPSCTSRGAGDSSLMWQPVGLAAKLAPVPVAPTAASPAAAARAAAIVLERNIAPPSVDGSSWHCLGL